MKSQSNLLEARMLAAYERRKKAYYRRLHPPLPLVYNRAEAPLPQCSGVRLFIGGAGGTVPHGFLNVDLSAAPGVDIACDIQNLPFADSSVSAVECDAVLEHVEVPEQAVREIFRVLRPGGYLHCVVPFCHPFHGYPSDFHRWSIEGLRYLLRDFQVTDVGVRTGPTATLLTFILEYLKILAPRAMKKAVWGIGGWLVWPARYMDNVLNKKSDSQVLANHIYALVIKPHG